MLPVLVVLFVIFLSISVLKRVKPKQHEKEKTKPDISFRQSVIQALYALDDEDPKAYTGETKKKIETFQIKVHELLEEVMGTYDETKQKEYESSLLSLQNEHTTLKMKKREHIANWKAVEENFKEEKDYSVSFFESHTFYPRTFPFYSHELEKQYMLLKENRRTNPFSDPASFQDFIEKYRKPFVEYTTYFKKFTGFIEEKPWEDERFSLHTQKEFLELQHELSIALQNEEFKTCKALLVRIQKKSKQEK